MIAMAVNKVVYGTTVLVDLTQDSVTPEALVEGYTAHGADGAEIEGANPYTKAETDATVGEQASLIAQIRTALNGKVAGDGEAADPVLQEKSVTPTKSAQAITPDSGYDGLSKVNVGAIPNEYIVPSGTKTVTANGTHDVNAYKSVSVNVPIPDGYIKPSGVLNVTANGSYDVTDKASVTVAVPENEPKLQEKTITMNGDVFPDSGYDGLSKVTVNVPTGGEETFVEPDEKDVNFYDYDGTRLYSYTVAEAQSLSALPPLPTRYGLVCQGWNYTLDEVKQYQSGCDVGATYITSDGKTRIYVSLPDGYTSPMVGLCPNGSVTVDWGDGTATNTLTGTSVTTVKWTPTHSYAHAGDYVITITPVSGSFGLGGHSSLTIGPYILRHATNGNGANYTYRACITKIELGANITTLGTHAFRHCTNMQTITIPSGIDVIDTSTFAYCVCLKGMIVPKGVTTLGASSLRSLSSAKIISIPHEVTTIGEYAFAENSIIGKINIPEGVVTIPRYLVSGSGNLCKVTIPNSVTSIASYAFANTNNITKVVYPKGLTSIGAAAFTNSYAIVTHDFSACESVPILENTSAFTGITSQCVFLIPSSLYGEWSSAENWTTYASKMVAV